jgi:hypothetical protein
LTGEGLAEMPTDDATAQQILMLMGGLARLNGALVAAGKRVEADEVAVMSARLREIAHGDVADPRPDDMAELARLTAAELRKCGIYAELVTLAAIIRLPTPLHSIGEALTSHRGRMVTLHDSQFDNLGPVACADEIVRQEIRHAQEWAGDK